MRESSFFLNALDLRLVSSIPLNKKKEGTFSSSSLFYASFLAFFLFRLSHSRSSWRAREREEAEAETEVEEEEQEEQDSTKRLAARCRRQ